MTLGAFLRSERERRGISLEQVASSTKISLRVLHDLEADQYKDLPAKPFVRGFVSSYAKFLDLDAQDVLTRFNDFIDEKSKERPTKDSGHRGYVFERKDGDQSRKWLWIILSLFACVGLITFILIKPKSRHHKLSVLSQPQSTASSTPEPVTSPSAIADLIKVEPSSAPQNTSSEASTKEQKPTTTPSPVSSPIATPKPIAAPSPIASPTPTQSSSDDNAEENKVDEKDPLKKGDDISRANAKYKVVIRSKKMLTLRYKVDDKPPQNYTLLPDNMIMFKAIKGVVIQVSTTEDTEVKVNGGFVPLTGFVGLKMSHDIPTLTYPHQLFDNIDELFKDGPKMWTNSE